MKQSLAYLNSDTNATLERAKAAAFAAGPYYAFSKTLDLIF